MRQNGMFITDHIAQRLVVRGRPEDVYEVFESIRGQQGSDNELFDLERIIPMPEAVKRTTLFAHANELRRTDGTPESHRRFNRALDAAYNECFEETGFVSWNDWAFNSWGTQGNVYRIRRVEGRENELLFCSADYPIFPAMRELTRQFPYISTMLDYAGETFTGRALYAQGDGLSMEFDIDSRQGRLIRKMLRDDVCDYVPIASGKWAN